MRLFALRNTRTGEVLPQYFESKPAAKQQRDALNGGPPSQEDIELIWVVTQGPDHD